MRSSFRQLQRLCFYFILVIIATACGGGGGGGGGGGNGGGGDSGGSGGSTSPVIGTGMNHEVTYDAATTPASIVGTRVNNLFGANHHKLQMVFNTSGIGMAVWITRTTGTALETEKLVYATYDPAADSWSAEKTIFVLTNESSTPKTLFKLAASDNDFAVAWKVSQVYRVTDENKQVWESFNYAKVFSNGAWTEAMRLNAYASNFYLQAPVVSSNGSSFLFAWQEDASMISREWNNGAMSGPASALSGGATYFNDIELVSNGTNYMLKVEHGSSVSFRHMTVVAYQSGSWSTPVTTEDNQGSINYSKIASAGSNYLMTWVQDSTPYYRYSSGGNWSAMTAITDGPTGNHQLASNGTDYSLSWVASNHLNVKLFSAGNWGNSETPESIPGIVDVAEVTGTSYGFNYSLRVQDSLTSDFDLYLLSYKGGVSGDSVLVENDTYKVFDHAIAFAFGNSKTFISWQQFDGSNMQYHIAAYNDNVVSSTATALSQASHGGGVTTGEVATTVGGVRVAAWGQTYFDATGTERRAAFARVDDNTGTYGATVYLRDYSNIRDVVVVGETVIVLLDVVDGLSAIEYHNGSWTSVTSFNGGFTYDWDAYVLNNQLFLFWKTVGDSYAAVYENGTWGAATTINTSALSAAYYDLTSNGEDVLVTWREWTNDPVTPSDFIKSRFYDSSTGLWSTEQTLDSYDAIVGGRSPTAVANASGFMVNWSRADTNTNPSTMSMYTSVCDAAGVCAVKDNMLSGIDTSYSMFTAANDNDFMFVYTLDGVHKYHVYNGSSWSAVADLGITNYLTLRLAGDGNDFVLFKSKDADTTNYRDDTVVDYYRYSAGSWSTPEQIIGLDAAISLLNFKVTNVPGGLILTWRSRKPGAHYNIHNLYTTSWNGSQWSGVEQINTGKFDVRKYDVDTTNNQLRFSFVQAQEGDTDPSAPALWELIK